VVLLSFFPGLAVERPSVFHILLSANHDASMRAAGFKLFFPKREKENASRKFYVHDGSHLSIGSIRKVLIAAADQAIGPENSSTAAQWWNRTRLYRSSCSSPAASPTAEITP
jgi:hypothetical protein